MSVLKLQSCQESYKLSWQWTFSQLMVPKQVWAYAVKLSSGKPENVRTPSIAITVYIHTANFLAPSSLLLSSHYIRQWIFWDSLSIDTNIHMPQCIIFFAHSICYMVCVQFLPSTMCFKTTQYVWSLPYRPDLLNGYFCLVMSTSVVNFHSIWARNRFNL